MLGILSKRNNLTVESAIKSKKATRNACIDHTPTEELRSQVKCYIEFILFKSSITHGSGVAAIPDIDLAGEKRDRGVLYAGKLEGRVGTVVLYTRKLYGTPN